MDTKEKRIALAKWILDTNENVLNEVETIYNVHSKNEETSSNIVAYTVSGKPLTKEMYIQKVKDAEASMNAGNFITSEDLLKEMKSW